MKYRGIWVVAAMYAAGCSFDVTAGGDGNGSGGADAGLPGDPDAAVGRPDARPPGPTPDAMPTSDPLGVVRAVPGTPDLFDRSFADWDDAPHYTFDIADAAHLRVSNELYQMSARVTFAFKHDTTHVYFALIVEDDHVSTVDTPLWDDDSISLVIDANGDRSGALGPDDHEIIVANDGTYADYGPGDAELIGDAYHTATGYAIEAGVSKATLRDGVLPSTLGFDIAINEDDDLGGPTVDAYGVWFMSDRPTCPSCCTGDAEPWCDTTTLGQLILE